MLLHSMWERTANKRPSYPRLTGDHHCDIVVIGAGFTGLSTAYHLQQHHMNTIVLEHDRVGSGASGRNGGEVLTGYLGNMEDYVETKGLPVAQEMWQLSLDAIDLIEHIITKNNIHCDFTRSGHFHAAYKKSHLNEMKKNQAFMARHFDYHPIKIVEKKDLPTELNTPFYHGGAIDEKSAHFHPLNYTLGLAEAVTKLRGNIFEESSALKIKWKSTNKVIVSTSNGRVIAKKVVMATNAYAGDIHKRIKKSIVPVESIMISTEPLTEKMMTDIIKKDRAVFDSKHLLYYFRRTADHRLAFGGSGRASSKRDLKRIYQNLHKGMLKVFPQLHEAKIEYRWGGKVGFTKTFLPYVGQLKDGTYFAFGYGGHGAAMATMLGKVIADAIFTETDINNPLKIKKLKPIAFHSQHAKGVGIMKLYKQFQDFIS
ncbi:NAD(P)/FAD-dependent oxidoreductase [Pseudogracilibacillus auburnensis]|uniref:Gamma-glutamylputrescine oxidase n=1 Tax=Pseudogracilibacillus auburnensis TaxID=1494959 RepID=A0A2V3W2V7_9BACI|nr:FAD-binding oxidoreductase [Pseudogracilibacillus auburnensis]MBO1002144.1 FAD-binding oxidoreductase [Pseudogracilibacillus auburnensis]PXW87468.1 gamma-glutamylputrescine oxidase [Pseudogracilibacillus auburnensis]